MSITEQFKHIFSNDYCGFDSFFSSVLAPLFGDKIERKNENLLADGRYRDKAERLKIKMMTYVAVVDAFEPIYIIDITVDNSCLLERSRVQIKELVRQMIDYYTQAFIVFHYANTEGEAWRFSYIYKEGKQTDVTPAKRFTYVFGRGYSGRTAAERFATLQGKPMDTADDFKAAFSVEMLSDEFFNKYKQQYERFCQFLYENKTNTDYFGEAFTTWNDKVLRDYVKKMLGRLVFIQFLHRKGWAPNLLDAYNSHPELQDNFLDAYLEPLFGGVLNTQPDRRSDEFRQNAKRGWSESLIAEFEKVPYLNGGLFESDVQDPPRSRFPKEYFRDLFEFFAQYNFTVDENDPQEAEIGVDPEMLGRIFENLLEDNKDKGAFYTPKEIVEYMCRESLIAYLNEKLTSNDQNVSTFNFQLSIRTFVTTHVLPTELRSYANEIKNALQNVKICDPAIGSGAFPMGLLNELVQCRVALDLHTEQNADRAEIKKHIIQNSIYGVDIEKGAVDIARLRFWLSIVVDEDVPQALPNLDYKIMQGNSLLEQYEGISLDMRPADGTLDYATAERTELQHILTQYYNTADHQRKQQLRSNIQTLVQTILTKSGYSKQLPPDLDLGANPHFFLWHTWFSDVFANGGFDIVIGNPPYVQLQNNGGALGKQLQNAGFESFTSTGDIYCLFYERGWQLLKKDGHLCYITSNKWMRAGYGEKTRKFFANNTNPMLLIDFAGVKIFESATVDTNILLFSKSSNRHETVCAVTNKQNKDSVKNLSDFVQQQNSVCDFATSDSWVILSPIEQSIKKKIEAVGTPLKDWDIQINYGIKTGFNDAFIISTEKREEILANCKTEDERQRTAELIRPILRGRDIKRYGYDWANLYLIATFPSRHYDIDKYPAVKQYLLSFGIERLEQTGKTHIVDGEKVKARKKTNNKWFETQDSISYWEVFSKQQIVWIELSDEPKFALTENTMSVNTVFFMTGEHILHLLGLLNSKLITWYFRHCIGTTSGVGTNRWLKYTIEQIPMAPFCLKLEELSLKISESFDHETDKEIERYVCQLYNLNDIEEKYIISQ